MLEILQNFEVAVGEAARLRPIVVACAGAAAVGVGLCVWLGGLSLRKPLVAIAGATAGGILGLLLIGRGVAVLAGTAIAAAVIARVFERVFIAVIGAVMGVFVAYAVLAGPYIESPQAGGAAASAGAPGEGLAGLEQFREYAIDSGGRMKKAVWLMPLQKLAIIVLPGVLFLAGGLILRRPTAALCFSAVGAMLVFAGMITLLVCKGAAPVSQISSRPLAYAVVFAAMTLFGMVEQLLLCRGAKAQAAPPEEPKGRSRRA